MLYEVVRPVVLIQIIGDITGMITMPYLIVLVSYIKTKPNLILFIVHNIITY